MNTVLISVKCIIRYGYFILKTKKCEQKNAKNLLNMTASNKRKCVSPLDI